MTTSREQSVLDNALKQAAQQLLSGIANFDASSILIFGNNSQDVEVIKARWPEARISFADANELPSSATFDLVFSNNYFQHLPTHAELINKLYRLLNKDGILAVQVPNALNMPIHVLMESISREKIWKDFFREITANYFVPKYYYEILSELGAEIVLWESYFNHIFSHYQEIVDFYSLTEMKPYLAKLSDDEMRDDFKNRLLNLLPIEYKKQTNSTILFPYRRTFFIAKKQ